MTSSLTAAEAGRILNARVVGNGEFLIDGVGAPAVASSHTACFVESESYLADFKQSAALCWVVEPKFYDGLEEASRKDKVFLLAEKPYLAFVKLISHFFPVPQAKAGVHKLAWVDPSAEIHPTAQIDAFVAVGARAKIGAGVILHPGVWVGDGATIGEGSILYAGAKIYHRCIVGRRNVLHAGSVIGSDGFGFLPGPTGLVKIPQVGRVVFHDDVELGANSTVDRGTLDDTVIGQGTKIDNLVQIGHNCKVGQNCALCAFVGLSGNTTLGNNVVIAGQTGTKGHLKIGDNVQVGAQSGVSKDIPAGLQVKGYPAQPIKDFLKLQVLFTKLPEIYKRLTEVEKKLDGGTHGS